MLHVEILSSPKDIIKNINNYEPYIFRTKYKNIGYSDWLKPMHSFIEIDNSHWACGKTIYEYDGLQEIEIKIKTNKGKESFCFRVKQMG